MCFLCRYDVSKECRGEGKYKDCTDCILDKIKTEFINRYPKNYAGELELGGRYCCFSLNEILEVIDKYKPGKESE